MTFHILGISSSQLTFIFFKGVETVRNHQPVNDLILLYEYGKIIPKKNIGHR
jgi:hypothetical protein